MDDKHKDWIEIFSSSSVKVVARVGERSGVRLEDDLTTVIASGETERRTDPFDPARVRRIPGSAALEALIGRLRASGAELGAPRRSRLSRWPWANEVDERRSSMLLGAQTVLPWSAVPWTLPTTGRVPPPALSTDPHAVALQPRRPRHGVPRPATPSCSSKSSGRHAATETMRSTLPMVVGSSIASPRWRHATTTWSRPDLSHRCVATACLAPLQPPAPGRFSALPDAADVISPGIVRPGHGQHPVGARDPSSRRYFARSFGGRRAVRLRTPAPISCRWRCRPLRRAAAFVACMALDLDDGQRPLEHHLAVVRQPAGLLHTRHPAEGTRCSTIRRGPLARCPAPFRLVTSSSTIRRPR